MFWFWIEGPAGPFFIPQVLTKCTEHHNKIPRGRAIEVLQGIVYFPGVLNHNLRVHRSGMRRWNKHSHGPLYRNDVKCYVAKHPRFYTFTNSPLPTSFPDVKYYIPTVFSLFASSLHFRSSRYVAPQHSMTLSPFVAVYLTVLFLFLPFSPTML